MLQLIYSSAATVTFSASDLRELLAFARNNNRSLDVTGMLLYQDGSFLQVLEGESEAVLSLYTKIEKDKRHSNIKLLLRKDIEEREFSEWSMGFFDATRTARNQGEGFVDFFSTATSTDPEEGRAKKALHQFKEGAWRQRVNVKD
ncbi:MAG: BLUF domain-containing protein [Planctomycetaceae bacterium]